MEPIDLFFLASDEPSDSFPESQIRKLGPSCMPPCDLTRGHRVVRPVTLTKFRGFAFGYHYKCAQYARIVRIHGIDWLTLNVYSSPEKRWPTEESLGSSSSLLHLR